ncbi:hypothetical protein ACE6H2_015440 [Prunus campanulata]
MDIPHLAWFKVLLVVAKQSHKDLYNMAATCKLFKEMLNDPEVWTTVSVDKYQWHQDWYPSEEGKIVEFLQKCKEHNNPEMIYREDRFSKWSQMWNFWFISPKESIVKDDGQAYGREVACCQPGKGLSFH